MAEVKVNGKFTITQWVQMFSAFLGALLIVWGMISFITGFAVRAEIRHQLKRPDGIITKEIDTAIEQNQHRCMVQNSVEHSEVMKELSKINTKLEVCKTEIEALKRMQ